MARKEITVRMTDLPIVQDVVATLNATRAVLAIREKELLDLKGPCSNTKCQLHYAHSGPCDTRVTPCEFDTNGDSDCGRKTCARCYPQHQPYPTEGDPCPAVS